MHYIAQSLVALDHRGIKLRWNPSTEVDIKGYQVYMSERDDQHFVKAHIDLIKEAEWVSTPLRLDVKYFFYITAVDRSGNESEPSSTISFSFDDSVIDNGLVPVEVTWSLPIAANAIIEDAPPTSNFMTLFTLGG